jgi:hypothetical protein
MLGPFLIMNSGCHYFRIHSSAKPYADVILKMQDQQKYIILHLGEKTWHLTDIKADENTITGKASALAGKEFGREVNPEKANRYMKNGTIDESGVLNEVHVYADALEATAGNIISIPSDEIAKVEIYDKAKGATAASWIGLPFGILAGAFGVVLIIVALTSCPFVYVYNGADYSFAGEIFSGAIQPGLERDDYLPLPQISSCDGAYRIKITNELKEVQSVNLAELMLVDHPEGISVLMDKYGSVHSLGTLASPVSAVAGDNTDILQLIKEKDAMSCIGLESVTDKDGITSIVLKFVKPDDATSARLVIRAKNSLWMEAVSSKIHGLFGERYNAFSAKREKVPGDELRKWQLDQKLPLLVYIEKNKRWQFADYFNIAGPAALRDDILPLDLEGIDSDTVRIRLETGFRFWDVDYTAMDFSLSEPLPSVRVSAATATASNGLEIKEVLAGSDNTYYVLDEQGDEALLVFNNPELKNNCRSVFLHTRGYYKVVRDQTGPPDKKTLRSFRKAGMIPAFSKEMYDGLK